MNSADLQRLSKSRHASFLTILRKHSYLFEGNNVYVTEPILSVSQNRCSLYIPKLRGGLTLKQSLGIISGSVEYVVNDLRTGIELDKYAFGFTHLGTLVSYIEGGKPSSTENYGFHFDLDRNRAEDIVHPLAHLQLTTLSVPRFTIPDHLCEEVTMFKHFLELIEKTFYKNTSPEKNQPSLELLHSKLTDYR